MLVLRSFSLTRMCDLSETSLFRYEIEILDTLSNGLPVYMLQVFAMSPP